MATNDTVVATLFTSNITYDSVTLNITGGSGYTHMRIYLRKDPDPGYATYDETMEMEDKIITVGGLEPNTKYAVNIGNINNNWIDKWTYTEALKFTTLEEPKKRPSKWSWSSNIESGKEIKLSASEWNDFCANINDVRGYLNLSLYSAGNFMKVEPGEPISASTVNHAVWAIKDMNSEAANYEVSPGDPITADFFNGLRDILNSIE